MTLCTHLTSVNCSSVLCFTRRFHLRWTLPKFLTKPAPDLPKLVPNSLQIISGKCNPHLSKISIFPEISSIQDHSIFTNCILLKIDEP